MFILPLAACGYTGLALLCLASRRARQVAPWATRLPTLPLRLGGWAFLFAGSVLGVGADAVLMWLGVLTIAAGCLSVGLSYLPKIMLAGTPALLRSEKQNACLGDEVDAP